MKKRTIAFLAILCLFTFPAAAGEGWIIGFSGGQSKLNDFRLSTTVLDDEDTVWTAFGGYQFAKYFAVVGGYLDLGAYHAEGPDFGGYVNDIQVDGYYVRALGIVPVSSRVSFLASVGLFEWDYDFRSAADAFDPARHQTDSGESTTYGAGIDVDLSGGSPHFRGFNFHAGWERLLTVGNRDTVEHENDYDLLLAGFTYNF